MDHISSLLPPVKVETLPISTHTHSSSSPNLIKQEQPDTINTHTGDILPPPFANSIDELRSLSTALSTFLCRYDELNNHLNIIKSSIDSKLSNHLLHTDRPKQSTVTSLVEPSCAHTLTAVPETVPERNPNGTASNCERNHEYARTPENPNSSEKPEEIVTSKKPEKIAISKKPDEINLLKKPEEVGSSKKPEEIDLSKKSVAIAISKKPDEINLLKKPEEVGSSKKPEEIDLSKKSEAINALKKPQKIDISKNPAVSELESLCKNMSFKRMKRYVKTHISDMDKIREELPKALKFAKDPAKLVLKSVGRFFVHSQRNGPYSNCSKWIVARLATVLILECFVMINSDGIEISQEVEKSAAEAAIDWKRRMINEGGLITADEVDARGLLLLISGFGIPDSFFENKDIRDLIKASNVKGISTALRRSIILIRKVPELINYMVKTNMEIEAADLAYNLGLEDKCHPQTILTTFVHNKIKDIQHTSFGQIELLLSYLKSLKTCLETHNLDPSKLFPDFKITEKIEQLDEEINDLDLKSTQKRKTSEEREFSGKRSRLSSHDNCATSSVSCAPRVAIDNGGIPMTNGGPYGSGLTGRFLGQPYSSQPSSSGLIGLYGGPLGLGMSSLESFPGLLDSGRQGPDSDLYSFADKVFNETYQG